MPKRRVLAALVVGSMLVSALAFAVVFVRPVPDSHDSRVMLGVTRSLVDEGEAVARRDWMGTPMRVSKYGLGMSLLFAAPYAVARWVDAYPVEAAMATNAGVFALTVVAVVSLARVLEATWGQAVVTSVLVAAGTPLLPLVATGFSELAVGTTATLGLVAVAAARKGRTWAAPVGGAAAGAATLLRSDSIALIGVVVGVALVVTSRRWRTVLGFALGALPFLAIWGWYNAVRFAAPWELGYTEDPGFVHPFGHGLYGLLLSPGRGLLWYAPLIVIALIGFRWAWRRDPVVTAAAIALLAVRPLFFASWHAWSGGWGWGPRFLVPAMPALTVGVLEVVRRWRRSRWWLQAPAAAVVLLSVGVQVVGVSVDYTHWNARADRLQQKTFDFDEYLFEWEYFPIREQAEWLVSGEGPFVGWALPANRRPERYRALMGTALVGALGAMAAARALDRDGPAGRTRRRARRSVPEGDGAGPTP